MVTNVTSFTGNGLRDWLWQRLSAVVITAYLLFLLGYWLAMPNMTYVAWHGLFQTVWLRVFTLVVLLNVLIHAWIGLWTVLTDYVKCMWLRLGLEAIIFVVLLATFVWGVLILWSV